MKGLRALPPVGMSSPKRAPIELPRQPAVQPQPRAQLMARALARRDIR